jgi:hypothetical protein
MTVARSATIEIQWQQTSTNGSIEAGRFASLATLPVGQVAMPTDAVA